MMKLLPFALILAIVAGSFGPILFMENRRRAPWVALACGGSSFALLVYLMVSAVGDIRAECEAKGGVMLSRSYECIKKEAVIK